MRDVLSWSLPLGRWVGLQVRLHVSLVLLAVLLVHETTHRDAAWHLWYALATLGLLMVSLMLHELAHVISARRSGGHADEIVLWPLGGLVPATALHDPRADLLVAAAGPLANLLVCAVCLAALMLSDHSSLVQFYPLIVPVAAQAELSWKCWPELVALGFWLNWSMLLVNLLPAVPLDGGRVLRSVIWLSVGQRYVPFGCTVVGQWTGVVMFLFAWLLHGTEFGLAWGCFLVLGVILFFSSREAATPDAARDDDPLGYDFSQGYTSLERESEEEEKDLGPVGRWLEERREARQERQRQIEEDEERRVDEILARLHIGGLEGLSLEDRQILDRVSARYRNRQKG